MAIYKRHAPYVAGVVYRVCGADSELDDILQETFIEGLARLSTVQEPAKLRGFLVTIAVRRVQARFSLRARMRRLVAGLFGVSPAVSDPDARARVHALYERLASAVPKKRVAWVLHRIEGYTLPEVADQTGASLASVKRWIADVDVHLEATDESP